MNPYTFARTIARAVAQDPALQAWAFAQFGKPLAVYLGLPSEAFPDMENDTPFLAFGDPSRTASQERRQGGYGLSGWMGIRCENYAVSGMDNYTEPAGTELIFGGLQLVVAAMASSLPGNIVIDEMQMIADTLGAHDWVEGHLAIEFTESIVIGQNPLE